MPDARSSGTQPRDAPGVIALPPLIYLGCLALAVGLEYLVPVTFIPDAVQYPLGIAVIVVSIAIMPPVLARFHRSGTNMDVRKPTTNLITSGPYRFSRNPIYMAMNLLVAGVGILVDGLWVLLSLVPAIAVIHYGVVLREERYLEAKFGETYRDYKRTVRRWI